MQETIHYNLKDKNVFLQENVELILENLSGAILGMKDSNM